MKTHKSCGIAAPSAILLLALASVGNLNATTTWTGGASTTNWADAANWDNGVPSGTAVASASVSPTGNALFNLTGASYTLDYTTVNPTFNNLTITNSGSNFTTLNISAALTTTGIHEGSPLGVLTGTNSIINVNSGGSMSLGGGIQLNTSTVNINSGGAVTFGTTARNQSFTFSGSTVTVATGGTLTGATGVNQNAGMFVGNGNGSATLNVAGGITEIETLTVANRGTASVNITSAGSLTVRGAAGISMGNINNIDNVAAINVTNGTLSNAGVLRIGRGTTSAGNSGKTGTSTFTVNGGAVTQTGVTTVGEGRVGILNVSSGSFTTSGDVVVGGLDKTNLAPTGSATASGAVNVSGGTLTVGAGGALRIGDGIVVSGSNAGYTVAGSLTLTGGTVTTDLLSATNGANSTVVFSGGTLITKGTAIANGSVFTVGNGTLAAKYELNTGTHSFANGLTVANNATLQFDINGTTLGTDYAAVNTAGLLTYGGALALNFGSTLLTGGETFDLFGIGIDGSTGSFTGMSVTGSYNAVLTNNSGVWTGSGGGFDFTFTESTGDLLVASAIPEPSTSILLMGLVAGMATVVRHRKPLRGVIG